ncbi:hypothetical protein DL95DRAFT_456431 [Leptodontidium sp. 2 PMI_412]|nr:hypothetical protein DL95DRAFT_456431 [Leptodontidium sp. 2 PMI_412]
MSIEMVSGMIVPEPRSTTTQGFGDRGMGIGVQFQPPPVGTGTMGSYQLTGHVPIPMIGPMNQQVCNSLFVSPTVAARELNVPSIATDVEELRARNEGYPPLQQRSAEEMRRVNEEIRQQRMDRQAQEARLRANRIRFVPLYDEKDEDNDLIDNRVDPYKGLPNTPLNFVPRGDFRPIRQDDNIGVGDPVGDIRLLRGRVCEEAGYLACASG